MSLAARHSSGPIVAVDQRHSAFLTTGEAIRGDYGGKLIRCGDAWAALGGDGLYCALASDALASAENLSAVRHCLRSLSMTAAFEIPSRWPGLPSDPRTALCFAVDPTSTFVLRHDGSIAASDAPLAVSYPARYPPPDGADVDRRALHDALQARLNAAASRWDAVRAIAAEFDAVAGIAESVSATIELGLGDHHLAGVSRELAELDDAELQQRLTSPPAPVQGAFTRILEEHFVT